MSRASPTFDFGPAKRILLMAGALAGCADPGTGLDATVDAGDFQRDLHSPSDAAVGQMPLPLCPEEPFERFAGRGSVAKDFCKDVENGFLGRAEATFYPTGAPIRTFRLGGSEAFNLWDGSVHASYMFQVDGAEQASRPFKASVGILVTNCSDQDVFIAAVAPCSKWSVEPLAQLYFADEDGNRVCLLQGDWSVLDREPRIERGRGWFAFSPGFQFEAPTPTFGTTVGRCPGWDGPLPEFGSLTRVGIRVPQVLLDRRDVDPDWQESRGVPEGFLELEYGETEIPGMTELLNSSLFPRWDPEP